MWRARDTRILTSKRAELCPSKSIGQNPDAQYLNSDCIWKQGLYGGHYVRHKVIKLGRVV